ncbi:MAG: diacylglycerol kinase [Alphaproteobacteria bacterium]|nr:diacylglycerol kinase [Alphaproteobacteria bacterium]
MKINLKNFGILSALKHSIDGLKYLIDERAFMQEILFSIVVVIALFLSSSKIEDKLYVFSAYCFILIAEAINTAIEAVIDRISMEIHPLSKKAKDIGSTAVLLAMVHFAIVFIALLRF